MILLETSCALATAKILVERSLSLILFDHRVFDYRRLLRRLQAASCFEKQACIDSTIAL